MTIDNRPLDKRLDALDSTSQEVDMASKAIDPTAMPSVDVESHIPYTTGADQEQDPQSPIILESKDSVFTGESTDVAGLKDIGGKIIKKIVGGTVKDVEEKTGMIDSLNKPIVSPGKEVENLKTFTVVPEAPASKVEKVLKDAEKIYNPDEPKNIASKIIGDITDETQLLKYKESVSSAYDIGKYKKMSYNDAVVSLNEPKIFVKKDSLTVKEFKTQEQADAWLSKQKDQEGFTTVTEPVYDENFLAKLMDRKIVTEANPDDLAKLPYLMRDVSERNESILKKYMAAKEKDPGGVETMDLLVQFKIGLALEGNLNKAATARARDVARSLGILNVAYKNAKTSPNRAKLLQDIIDQAGGVENIDDIGTHYLALNRGERANLAEKTIGGSLKDIWYATWVNGLLSAPLTHAKNILGNTSFTVIQPLERATASGIGFVRTSLGIGSKDYIGMSEVAAQTRGMVAGLTDSFRLAGRAWKTNMPTDQATKLEYGRIGKDDFDVNLGESLLARSLSNSIKYYGQVVTLPGRALMTEDEFFKAWGYRMELPALVDRAGNNKRRELIAKGMDKYLVEQEVLNFKADLYTNPTDEIHQAALTFGKTITFTKELDGMAAKFNEIVNTETSLMGMVPEFAYGKLFFPFVRTPSNIINETLDRTVFKLPSALSETLKNGGIESDIALAKITLAGAAMVTLYQYTLADKQFITGAGPIKYKDLDTLKATGWQPFSWIFERKNISPEMLKQFQDITKVSIGPDKVYVSYESLGPLASLIGMSASAAEYSMTNPDNEGLMALAANGSVGLYSYMKDLDMLQGLSDIHDAFAGKPGEVESKLYQVLKNVSKKGTEFAIGGSPAGAYSSLSASWERYSNPDKSNTMSDTMITKAKIASSTIAENIWDEGSAIHDGFFEALGKYRSRNPLTSDDLPPALDPLTGNIQTAGKGVLREIWNPMTKSTGKFAEGYATLIEYNIPRYVPPKNKDGVTLSAGQYNRWIELATDGGNLEERVVKLGDMYKKVKGIDTESAQAAIKKEMSDAYGQAWLQLKQEDSELDNATSEYLENRKQQGR